MFIYQEQLKSKLKDLHYIRKLYDGNNTELIADTLATAYTVNNSLFHILNLTYEEMYEEFKNFLEQRKYRWILVYYEKEQYLKNIFSIIAVISYTDICDLKLTEQEKLIINFDVVPSINNVRQYVRLRALHYFFSNYDPQPGQMFVTGAFAFSQKFMGTRQSLKIYVDSLEFIQQQGYKLGFGWSANDIAKNLYDKLKLILRKEQNLQNIYIQETNSFPYKNLNIIQVLYIGIVDLSIKQLRSVLCNK